jgi:hypothetical protein
VFKIRWVEVPGGERFKMLVMVPSTSKDYLERALPVLSGDGNHLNTYVKGNMLILVNLAGTGETDILMWALVPWESGESWTFSIEAAIEGMPELGNPNMRWALITDRDKVVSLTRWVIRLYSLSSGAHSSTRAPHTRTGSGVSRVRGAAPAIGPRHEGVQLRGPPREQRRDCGQGRRGFTRESQDVHVVGGTGTDGQEVQHCHSPVHRRLPLWRALPRDDPSGALCCPRNRGDRRGLFKAWPLQKGKKGVKGVASEDEEVDLTPAKAAPAQDDSMARNRKVAIVVTYGSDDDAEETPLTYPIDKTLKELMVTLITLITRVTLTTLITLAILIALTTLITPITLRATGAL